MRTLKVDTRGGYLYGCVRDLREVRETNSQVDLRVPRRSYASEVLLFVVRLALEIIYTQSAHLQATAM